MMFANQIKSVRFGFQLTGVFILILAAASSAVAIPILTFDSDGTPAQLDLKVEKNPDLYIKIIKS